MLSAHCYAETLSLRHGWSKKPWTPENAAENVILHPERLEQPLKWRKPKMIFVNSMSDLFHEQIPYEFTREVFNTMRRCDGGIVAATGRRDPSHVFQILTKRPEVALELWRARKLGFVEWPAHIWLGVSIENARHTWRADVLRKIPAAVRFISAEPLLGSLYEFGDSQADRVAVYERWGFAAGIQRDLNVNVGRAPLDLDGIDWLIAGGESGPGSRPMNLDWARELRDDCLAHDVPFFFKQVGGRTPKSGGKMLDGREWCEFPPGPWQQQMALV